MGRRSMSSQQESSVLKIVTLFFSVLITSIVGAQSITITSVSGTAFCEGDAINVSYSKTGRFRGGNVFSLELSDAVGSFSSPIVIGTLTSRGAGTINGIIPNIGNGTQYRVRITSTNPIVTSPINSSNLSIGNNADDLVFGNNQWNAYVYDGRSFNTLSGSFVINPLVFNTTSFYSNTSPPSDAVGYSGCSVSSTDVSVAFKRTNFDCGTYQIDLDYHDDEMSIYVDGVLVFEQTGYGNTINDVWNGFLGPSSTVDIRYANGGGPGSLSITVTKLNSNPGVSLLKSINCSTLEQTLNVIGVSGVSWSPAAGLSSTSGNSVVASPSETTIYTASGISECDGLTLSSTITVGPNYSDTAYGDNEWLVFSYDNSDFTNYRGYYTVDDYSFNTLDSWTTFASPSETSNYQGCSVGNDSHSQRHKRRGFPCGEYAIDVLYHDDDASLYVNNILVWSRTGYGSVAPGIWSGQLNENSTVEFRMMDGAGASSGNLRMTSSVLDTTIWLGNTSNWSSASNWSNGLPSNTITSNIPSVGTQPILSSNIEVADLILANNTDLTINTNNTLTVAGSINVPSGNSDILGHVIMKEGGCDVNVINSLNPLDISVLEIDHASSIENIGAMVNVTDKLMFTKGEIKTNDKLTLVSTQTKTAYLDKVGAGTISGNLTVQRWVGATSRKWWHLSTPVSNATAQDWQQEFPITGEFTGADFLDGNDNPSVKWYDETDPSSSFNDGWTNYPAATNAEQIVVGRGYRVYLRKNRSVPLLDTTIDLSGTPNMGSFTLPISYTVGDDALSAGWNFVGNPYPSAIDWNSTGWSKSNLQNAIYVWDALNSRYLSYVDGVGANGGTNQIASGQSFWVRAENSNASLQVTEDCKISDQVPLYRSSSNVVYVNIENQGKKSNTALRFMDEAKQTFDTELDAYYFGGSYPVNIGSYNTDWDYFSINSLPKEGEYDIPLYVYHKNIQNTVFTLSFEGIDDLADGSYLTLTDVYKGITTEITSDDFTYDFEYDGSNGSKGGSRFVLRKKVSKVTDVVAEQSQSNSVSVYPNRISSNESFSVLLNGAQSDGELSIVNMQGEVVKTMTFNLSMDVQEISPNLSVGFYTVVISTDEGVSTAKLVVK